MNDIITYMTMCQRENAQLQRGMNFHLSPTHSVVLMSVRPGAPYHDQIEEDGLTLIYEGHDVPRNADNPNPKSVDQPEFSSTGRRTQNGKFHEAAQNYKEGEYEPDVVRVYEKIKKGIWSYNGAFKLVDSWQQSDGLRSVFKFKLELIDEPDYLAARDQQPIIEHARLIPSHVKYEVYVRDGGKCVECESEDNLHYDHILPYSKGGSSKDANNIQLLCARHNLQKSNKII